MLCDFHAHLFDEPGYADALAETAHNLGMDKLCIGGGEARYGMLSNASVLRQAATYPDLFIPFACVRLGMDGAALVEDCGRAGFSGLRVSAPPAPYDSPAFFPVYEAAAALDMPMLFNTGLLPATALDRSADVRCEHMRPVYLDTLARQLPELKIIGCGLGGPWYDEAAETLAWHENVHFDLSGNVLQRKGTGFLRGLLGAEDGSVWGQGDRRSVWSRIVFGTGVRHEEIASAERDYQRLFRALALPQQTVDDIMGGNAGRLLGLLE